MAIFQEKKVKKKSADIINLFPIKEITTPDSKIIDSLALNLMKALNIPNGIELITILGTGSESDNFQSIHTWVKNNYGRILDSTPADGFELLKQSLYFTLYEYYYC